ncbi:AflR-like C6 transcription factor [Aspergillus bombycis]|uniref:AflR-like C6 transcription factor n=1 Tax=Aspergillus bombycis TaxID=109264 RepID=A0A1F8A8P6_9EURO|nr:AflR-like C6 transcription factor [Aspergillus bombycis]OGM47668.1 AflR-like C6 transcription factor [Aspergillus bombycis]
MSRRLGRPAKKRDSAQDDSLDCAISDHPRHQTNRRVRSPRKRKVKRDSGQRSGHDITNPQEDEEVILDEITFNDSIVDDMSTEDTRLPTPPFLDTDKLSLYEGADTIDLSDNWLQEFISGQSADLAQDRNFLDALGINNADTGLTAIPSSTKDLTGSTGTIDVASFELQDQVPLGAYYPPASGHSAYSEPTTESAQVMADIASPYTAFLKRDSIAWPQTVPSSTESDSARLPTASDHLNPLITSKGQRRTHEYSHSSEGPGLATTITARQYQCQCHDHIARDLMLLNISASRTWPTVTIDSILKCQQILQQLTDTILECAICCKTRVNLLMIVVVSIDSLVTALETITSVDSGVWDGVFVEYHESRLREYGQEGLNGAASRRYKNANFHFKAQVEECPLLVGGFPVPSEEKFAFVKQVLHARLCGLSSIIGRIQRCTEEILALPSSWGRLSMITETNRRVQSVMTKMKLPAKR